MLLVTNWLLLFVLQMGEVGPVWLYPLAPLDCVIADPKRESKLYGLKSFIEYQITPSVRNISSIYNKTCSNTQ